MKTLTPIKAIRKNCLDCSGNSYEEVRLCPITDCPLYRFRLGKNPNYPKVNKNPFPKEDIRKGIENSIEFFEGE